MISLTDHLVSNNILLPGHHHVNVNPYTKPNRGNMKGNVLEALIPLGPRTMDSPFLYAGQRAKKKSPTTNMAGLVDLKNARQSSRA